MTDHTKLIARPINCGTGHCSCIECVFEADAKPKPFTPDWSRDSAAAESIREHQAICNLLLKEMRHIAGISTGQVKRVAEQALEDVKQAQPEPATHDAPHYLEIERSQGMPKLEAGPVPVLYSDTINGCMVRRDDVWLCTTPMLSSKQAQPERAPLSLQEIADAWGLKPENIPASDIEAVREIEAAHGIKQGGQQ